LVLTDPFQDVTLRINSIETQHQQSARSGPDIKDKEEPKIAR